MMNDQNANGKRPREENMKDNRRKVKALEVMKKSAMFGYKRLDQDLREDKDIILAAVQNSSTVFRDLSPSWLADKDVIRAGGYALRQADPSLRDDKEFVLEAIAAAHTKGKTSFDFNKDHGFNYKVSKRLQEDEDIIRASKYLAKASDELKDDKEFVLECVGLYGSCLREASDRLRGDPEVLKASGYMLSFASDELRDNKEIVLQALKVQPNQLQHASPRLLKDPDLILAAGSIEYATPEQKDDMELVRLCLEKDAENFKYVSDRCKDDKEIAVLAVQKSGANLFHASKRLQADKEVVVAAVRNHGFLLEEDREEDDEDDDEVEHGIDRVPSTVRNDPDVEEARFEWCRAHPDDATENLIYNSGILSWLPPDMQDTFEYFEIAICKSNSGFGQGHAFDCASDRLKDDLDSVRWLMEGDRKVVEYASERVQAIIKVEDDPMHLSNLNDAQRDNREIVLAALRAKNDFGGKGGLALEFASERLRNDRETVEAAIQQQGEALRFASAALQHDIVLAKAAVKNSATAFAHVPPSIQKSLQSDGEFMLDCVIEDGLNLQHCLDECRNDLKFVQAAVSQNGNALQFASTNLQANREVVLKAVLNEPSSERNQLRQKPGPSPFQYADSSLKGDAELVKRAVRTNGMALGFASVELQDQKDIVGEAVKSFGEALQFASPRLRADKQIVVHAIRTDANAFRFAAPLLRIDWEIGKEAVALANKFKIQKALEECPELHAHFLRNSPRSDARSLLWQHSNVTLRDDLRSALRAIRRAGSPKSDTLDTVPAILVIAEGLKRQGREKIWILSQCRPQLPADVPGGRRRASVTGTSASPMRRILQMAGLSSIFHDANCLIRNASFLVAHEERGRGWDKLMPELLRKR